MTGVRIGMLQWVVGTFCALMGGLMLVTPHQFQSPAYSGLQAHLSWWGAAFLLAAALLLWTAAFRPQPAYVFLAHISAGTALLTLAYGSSIVNAWVGMVNYAVWGLATAVAPLLSRVREDLPDSDGIDLFAVVAGTGAGLIGLVMLTSPDQFTAPMYAHVRDGLQWFGLAFLVGGPALVAVQVFPSLREPFRWAMHLSVAGLYLVWLAAVQIPFRNWTGIAFYGASGIALVVLPTLGPRLSRFDPASLRTRLALALAAAATLPLFALLVLDSGQEQQAAIDRELDHHRVAAVEVAEDTADYLRLHHAAVITLATQPGLADLPQESHRELLRIVSAAYTDLAALIAYDGAGNPIASSSEGPPVNVASLPVFAAVRDTNEPALDVHTSPLLERPVFVLGAPIRDAAGRFAGFAVGILDSAKVAGFLTRVSAAEAYEGMEAYLVDDRGRAIASPEGSDTAAFADLSTTVPVRALAGAGGLPGSLIYTAADGERLAAYAPVPRLGWTVVVEHPIATAIGSVRRRLDVYFGVVLMVIGATAAVGAAGAGWLIAPLSVLARAVATLAEGGAVSPVPRSSVTEVARFADVLSDLRDRLAARTAERDRAEAQLRAVNLFLEQRVLERTAQLVAANEDLQTEVKERLRAEDAVRREAAFVRLLQLVAVAANEGSTVGEVIHICLDQVCTLARWPVGHAYLLAPDASGELASTNLWHADDAGRFTRFRQVSEGMRFAPGVGLVGQVLLTRAPVWVVDITKGGGFLRWQEAEGAGLRTGVAFPVLVGPEVVAVLEFFSLETMEQDAALLEVMGHIGTQLGRAFERERAHEEIRALNAQLERRVVERTAQLEAIVQDLEEQIRERARAEAERDRLYEAERERAARLHLLVEMGKDLVGARGLEALLELAVRRALAFTRFDAGTLLLFAGPDGPMEIRASVGLEQPALGSPVDSSLDSLPGRALHLQQPIVVDGCGEAIEATWRGYPTAIAAGVFLPLVTPDGRAIGVLVLESTAELRDLGAQDIDALQLVAAQLAPMVESALLQERLQRSFDVLLALYDAGRVLGSTLQLAEVGTALLDIARRASGFEVGIIRLLDERRRLRVWQAVGYDELRQRQYGARAIRAARREAVQTGMPRFCRLSHPERNGAPMSAWFLPLRARDQTVGIFEAYGSELAGETTGDVLGSLANQASIALENARLYGQLADRERQLQDLVGRLLLAQEEERRRVAYDVHDGLAQMAAAAWQHLEAFASGLRIRSRRGREDLDRALMLTRRTVQEARRVIAGLRPTALDDFGLATAVRLEVDRYRAEGWEIDYEEGLDGERLPSVVETSLFRIAQEALTNVRKHADCTRAQVVLQRRGQSIHLEVRDWGRGFRPSAVFASTGPSERVGLRGIQERVALLEGRCAVRSRPGAGTRILVEVPLPSGRKGQVSRDE